MIDAAWSIAAIIFLGTLVRSTFGFGDALVAMPLLAFVVTMKEATPIVAMASAVVAIWVTLEDWKEIKLASAGWLAAFSCTGIPLGVYLLVLLPEPVVKSLLAAVIIGFAGYRLLGFRLLKLANDRWSFGFGLAAGLLGGAYNAQGPPIVIYGVMRGWSPTSFRATMQGFFVPTTMVLLGCHWWWGLWTREVQMQALFSLPAVLVAIPVGKYFHGRLAKGRFDRYVNALLLLIGIALAAKVWQEVSGS